MQIWLIVILAIILILVFWFISVYNSLVGLRNRVKDQWAQIDVVLKRRADLIPNLVETVKGYMKHENETLEAVIKARNSFVSASNITEEMDAANQMSATLGRLFALSESYPDLKANQGFLDLQKELTGTEDKITYARQFYNDTVLNYNNKVEMFPSSIVASMMNFKQMDFFKASDNDREVPKVSF